MKIPRESLPKYAIPLFSIWVAVCNLTIIVISSIWYASKPGNLGNNPGLIFGVVLSINILSLMLLYPMFSLDSIPVFLIPALIWYLIVSTIYLFLGLYLFLIPGTIQLAADIWFHFILKKAES